MLRQYLQRDDKDAAHNLVESAFAFCLFFFTTILMYETLIWGWRWFDITYCKWSRWHLNGGTNTGEASPSRQTVKWKTKCYFSTHSPTIHCFQKSISTLGSWDKDEDERWVVQNIALWDGPEAADDKDSERLHLYMLTMPRTCVLDEMLRGQKLHNHSHTSLHIFEIN